MKTSAFNRIWRSVMFVLLLAVAAWAPLPFASNRPWASAVLTGLLGLLLLLWAASTIVKPERLRLPWQVMVASLSTLLVAVWSWAQMSPSVVDLHTLLAAHPIWTAADEVSGSGPAVLAIDSWAARDALAKLLGYAAAFWLAFAMCQQADRARRLMVWLTVVITLYAVYGLATHFAGSETILWESKRAYRGNVTATFVNRNNFATYANLGVLLCLGLIVESLLAARSVRDARRIAVELIGRLLGKQSLLLLALVVLVTAVLLSGSRGGLLTGAAAIVFLLVLVFLVTRPSLKTSVVALALVGILGWGALGLSGGATLARLGQVDNDADLKTGSRFAVYELATRMIEDRPWTGHGYGGFEQVFYLYRDARFPQVFDKAHNTYLEHAVELGLPAALLLYIGPLLLLGLCLRGMFQRRRNQIFPLVAASATVLVSLHALVDFSLQIPAVAVTFAVILGMGCAQALPSEPAPCTARRSQDADAMAADRDVMTPIGGAAVT